MNFNDWFVNYYYDEFDSDDDRHSIYEETDKALCRDAWYSAREEVLKILERHHYKDECIIEQIERDIKNL